MTRSTETDSTETDESGRPVSHTIGPLDRCPGCGGSDFLVDEPEGLVVFHCLGCNGSWRYELGYIWRVAS